MPEVPNETRSSYFFDLEDYRKKENLEGHYDKWAVDYDAIHSPTGWLDLQTTTTVAFAKYVENKDSEVLDIACGTGLTSLALIKHGFSKIDGIDASKEMLDKAHLKGIFRSLKKGSIIETESLDCPENSYDAIVCCGAIAKNSIHPEYALREFIRITKPGGIIVYTVNDMKNELNFMETHGRLLNESKIKLYLIEKIYYYKVKENDTYCYLCVAKVL